MAGRVQRTRGKRYVVVVVVTSGPPPTACARYSKRKKAKKVVKRQCSDLFRKLRLLHNVGLHVLQSDEFMRACGFSRRKWFLVNGLSALVGGTSSRTTMHDEKSRKKAERPFITRQRGFVERINQDTPHTRRLSARWCPPSTRDVCHVTSDRYVVTFDTHMYMYMYMCTCTYTYTHSPVHALCMDAPFLVYK